MGTVAVADGHLKEYVCPSVFCGSTEVYKQDSTHWSMHKPSFHFRSSRRNQSFTEYQQLLAMMCYHLHCWALLLLASGPLLAHPITDSAEMPFPGPGE